MNIKEYIEQDKQEGLLGIYRVVDEDITVGMLTRDGNISREMIEMDVQNILDKMGVDRYYSVFDIRTVMWVSPDARQWIHSDMAARIVKGYAVIAETPLTSIIADVWTKLVNLPFPVKKFSRFEEGMEWIKALKADHEGRPVA